MGLPSASLLWLAVGLDKRIIMDYGLYITLYWKIYTLLTLLIAGPVAVALRLSALTAFRRDLPPAWHVVLSGRVRHMAWE